MKIQSYENFYYRKVEKNSVTYCSTYHFKKILVFRQIACIKSLCVKAQRVENREEILSNHQHKMGKNTHTRKKLK